MQKLLKTFTVDIVNRIFQWFPDDLSSSGSFDILSFVKIDVKTLINEECYLERDIFGFFFPFFHALAKQKMDV